LDREQSALQNARTRTTSKSGRAPDAPDDRRFNLRWNIQVGDTTLLENLPFMRHYARFNWSWANGSKAVEILLVVQAAGEV
jgi:hypothetical protein